MQLNCGQQTEQINSKGSDVFESLKSFIDKSGDKPKKYLEHCFAEYKEKIRKEIIKNQDITILKEFVENYRQFIFLDWQNLVTDFINANNKAVFYFFVILKKEGILPTNLLDCPAFQKYQALISNKVKLKELFKNEARFKIEAVDMCESWKDLEQTSDKVSYYVLSIECATYVRSINSEEIKNIIDVSSDIILTDGLSFKPALDKDVIVYLEVENV